MATVASMSNTSGARTIPLADGRRVRFLNINDRFVDAGGHLRPGMMVDGLHPALPGKFAGAHAIERTFEAYKRGEVESGGCMVHIVVPEVDAGPVPKALRR